MIAKVYIETLGCQMNVADTERARSGLLSAGYALTESEDAADVVMFNSCSVRARATQKLLTRIGEVRYKRLGGPKPVIGVMGCVAQLEGSTLFDNPSVSLVVGTRATDRLPHLIASALEGSQRVIDLDERAEGEVWNVPTAQRHSKYVAFVPIIEGCNKFCSYCIVPFSRGRENSRTADDILTEVHRLRDHGYREIHLIGQNVNSYRPKS
jgi:tRNA-2-methylthio-N6-dimethylallyladenosine synthase